MLFYVVLLRGTEEQRASPWSSERGTQLNTEVLRWRSPLKIHLGSRVEGSRVQGSRVQGSRV